MAIDKISGTAWTSISKLGSVSTGAIANVLGQTPPGPAVSYPTIDSHVNTTLGSVSSWTINHQNPTAGQLILLICLGDEGSYNHTFNSNLTNMTASGFTSEIDRGSYNNWPGVNVESTINVLWKVATGSEGTSSISMAQDLASYVTVWYILIDGANTTTPVNVISNANTSDSASVFPYSPPTLTHNGIATTTNDSLVFAVFACEGAGFEPFTVGGTGWPTSFTGESDSPSGGTGTNLGVSGGWATKVISTAGTSGPITTTGQTKSFGAYLQAVSFAIQP